MFFESLELKIESLKVTGVHFKKKQTRGYSKRRQILSPQIVTSYISECTLYNNDITIMFVSMIRLLGKTTGWDAVQVLSDLYDCWYSE